MSSTEQNQFLEFDRIIYCLEISILLLEHYNLYFIDNRLKCLGFIYQELKVVTQNNVKLQRKIFSLYTNFLEHIGIALTFKPPRQEEAEMRMKVLKEELKDLQQEIQKLKYLSKSAKYAAKKHESYSTSQQLPPSCYMSDILTNQIQTAKDLIDPSTFNSLGLNKVHLEGLKSQLLISVTDNILAIAPTLFPNDSSLDGLYANLRKKSKHFLVQDFGNMDDWKDLYDIFLCLEAVHDRHKSEILRENMLKREKLGQSKSSEEASLSSRLSTLQI